jgi:hypothetical protein
MIHVTGHRRRRRSLRQVLSFRGRRSPVAWLRDDLRSGRTDPLGSRASVRIRTTVRLVRRRPRLLLALLLDLVIVVGLFAAVLAMLGKLSSFAAWWPPVCLGLVTGLWNVRVRAAYQALEHPRGAQADGGSERPGVRREDQVRVAELVRAQKH